MINDEIIDFLQTLIHLRIINNYNIHYIEDIFVVNFEFKVLNSSQRFNGSFHLEENRLINDYLSFIKYSISCEVYKFIESETYDYINKGF